MKMKDNDKPKGNEFTTADALPAKHADVMCEWFTALPDESLPFRFHEKMMNRIREEAQICEKRNERRELFGYVSGAVVMVALCIGILYSLGIPSDSMETGQSAWMIEMPVFEMPVIEWAKWELPKPDEAFFHSQSFSLSVYVGALALLLLFAD